LQGYSCVSQGARDPWHLPEKSSFGRTLRAVDGAVRNDAPAMMAMKIATRVSRSVDPVSEKRHFGDHA
jgi:hypothetical protein